MNSSHKIVSALFLAASLVTAAFAAAEKASEKAAPASPVKSDYPLTTCLVSDEKLGEMGKPVEYVYKQAGQPDRVVYFCCKNCIADFEKEPAKYLKKVDEAAAAKAPHHHD